MASSTQAFILSIFLSLQILISSNTAIKSSAQAANDEIAVYWGQNSADGTLNSTCDSGLYNTVVIGFLNVFGCGRDPQLNLGTHCSGANCAALEADIKRCQNNSVKVYLSVGGPSGDYALCNTKDAQDFANYLYDKFLSNQDGPLGIVVLDGIDIRIENSTSYLYWDDLARALDNQPGDFFLSGAPRCVIPDPYLGAAIGTGVFNQLFVLFYNNATCQYSQNNPLVLQYSWGNWTLLVKSSTRVFLGLPAAPTVADGYISPGDLNSEVLSLYAKDTTNYGGVAVWNRGYDVNSGYTANIKQYVIMPPPPTPALRSFVPNNIYYYI